MAAEQPGEAPPAPDLGPPASRRAPFAPNLEHPPFGVGDPPREADEDSRSLCRPPRGVDRPSRIWSVRLSAVAARLPGRIVRAESRVPRLSPAGRQDIG